ncbi:MULTISPECIES: cysteine hydrolase family protein [unclassified Streptomyces]|uniref:cysteine hydrolase family protein n=1 Tax=unclassified Streptomyces TaxID=2593676 RepID=UPI0025B3D8A1|nr:MULTISPECIES: cysteine hydrolase family protein [unclassified Streptomyces]MDN3244900.1 cysteine hydrolase family protein [Streptomyces sp. ZSW22]MDN3254335.1 cysteine hydrolase family protein [Streptomyces sp. MA25(2023)]
MTAPRRALVLIDVQQEYFDGPLSIQYPPRDESLANILRALDTATRADMPVVALRHQSPEGFPVFAAGTPGWELHPEVERRLGPTTKRVTKNFSDIFTATGLAEWFRENGIDTLTLVGYMTNNCVLSTSAAAEPLGLTVEVLSDATGAVHLSNEAGTASAQQVHETLMTLLHSNWAAVTTTDKWSSAVTDGDRLTKSDLVTSALQGLATH